MANGILPVSLYVFCGLHRGRVAGYTQDESTVYQYISNYSIKDI